MILDYPWVEVYLPSTIKEITENCIKRSRREIIKEYEAKFGELNTHTATLFSLWNTAMEGKEFQKQHIQGVITLTDILIWEQNNLGLDANTKRIKAIQPEHITQELVRRNLEWFDVYEIHERDKYAFNETTIKQFFTGTKKRPSFEVTTYITKFIIEFDNKLLDLPKSKGKRWDIDEWRRTATIKVKQSWEEERD
jgi:ribosomal protein S17E